MMGIFKVITGFLGSNASSYLLVALLASMLTNVFMYQIVKTHKANEKALQQEIITQQEKFKSDLETAKKKVLQDTILKMNDNDSSKKDKKEAVERVQNHATVIKTIIEKQLLTDPEHKGEAATDSISKLFQCFDVKTGAVTPDDAVKKSIAPVCPGV